MVVECRCCSRRFNLNENLLRPAGSRVRCSKCGAVFKVYPDPSGGSRNFNSEPGGTTQDSDQADSAAPVIEKRKHPRLPVSIPVLCDALDLNGNPIDLYIGSIKEVSQAGLGIELFSAPISEQVSLSFINVENKDVQIQANVVHSRKNSFMTWIGLSLSGSAMEVDHFVTQVMKTRNLSCGVDQQVQI